MSLKKDLFLRSTVTVFVMLHDDVNCMSKRDLSNNYVISAFLVNYTFVYLGVAFH